METPTLMRNNMRLQTIGRTHELPESCQAALRESISLTARNSGTTLVLALNYSGRAELADAVRAIVREAIEGRIQPEEVTSELIDQHLYTAGIPDPDLLIRTSGEMRLSNFLLWQCSYTEFYITETLWPDFTREEFRRAISDFGKRDRRFGGLQKHGKATTDSDR
jgi:undecaprenyl diphosphate synthase